MMTAPFRQTMQNAGGVAPKPVVRETERLAVIVGGGDDTSTMK
jgi:hypothetical protein